MAVIVTKDNFDIEVLNCDKPVLVDFFANWCGPCKMLAPVIDEFAKKMEDNVKVCKVNVDEQPELAIRFGISSIPAIITFKNGEVYKRDVGFMSVDELELLLK